MTDLGFRVRRIVGAMGAAALLGGCGFSGAGPQSGGAAAGAQPP